MILRNEPNFLQQNQCLNILKVIACNPLATDLGNRSAYFAIATKRSEANQRRRKVRTGWPGTSSGW